MASAPYSSSRGNRTTIDVPLAVSTHADLSRSAKETGVTLEKRIIDLLSERVSAELVAPSPDWRAIPAVTTTISISLTDELISEVTALASGAGQHLSVVIYNLLNGGLPPSPPTLPLGYLRTEPGRGRVFGMYFEIAGYQYALLRHLAGDHLSVRRVMDIAFISLARVAASSGTLNGHAISVAAQQFAAKVMMIENRRRAPGGSSSAIS